MKDRRPDPMVVVDLAERVGADRRLHERVVVDIEVDYRADDTFLFAYITDLSAMGIFIHTRTPLDAGTTLNLCFRALSGQLLELAGEVIWVNLYRPHDPEGRNPGMGVRFRELEPWQREELLRMVRTFAYLDDEPKPDDEGGTGNGGPLGPS